MQAKRDVAILEEPEHLSWFNRSFRWSLEFNHVIGAIAVNNQCTAVVKPGLTAHCPVCRDHAHQLCRLRTAGRRSACPIAQSQSEVYHTMARCLCESSSRLPGSAGIVGAQVMRKSTEWLTRIHCHKVLSGLDKGLDTLDALRLRPRPRSQTYSSTSMSAAHMCVFRVWTTMTGRDVRYWCR